MDLKGKVINFLGDSITEGTGVTDKEHNRYDNRLRTMYDLGAVYNYGIGGTRLAYQQKPSDSYRFDLCFCSRAYDLNPNADIIVVYGGVNDYIHGDAYFGNMEDKTPETFTGAVRSLMTLLLRTYPKSTVVFMTPARCAYPGIDDSKPSPRQIKKPDARALIEYVKVIKEIGNELGIPVLDLYENLGINPNIEDDKVKYTVDGLHFNDDGHELLAKSLGKFLEKL